MNHRARLDALGAEPLDDRQAPLDAAFLQRLEATLGAPLPRGYAAFLRALGATSLLNHDVVLRAEDGEESNVEIFFGADPDGSYDLMRNYETYGGRVPAGLLPIADDAFGNIICLGIHAPHHGAVYFWDHEAEASAGRPAAEGLHRVAATFEAFLSGLVVVDDDG